MPLKARIPPPANFKTWKRDFPEGTRMHVGRNRKKSTGEQVHASKECEEALI